MSREILTFAFSALSCGPNHLPPIRKFTAKQQSPPRNAGITKIRIGKFSLLRSLRSLAAQSSSTDPARGSLL